MIFGKYIKCRSISDSAYRYAKIYLRNFKAIFTDILNEYLEKCCDKRGLPYTIDAVLVETISLMPLEWYPGKVGDDNFEVHIDYEGFKKELIEELNKMEDLCLADVNI